MQMLTNHQHNNNYNDRVTNATLVTLQQGRQRIIKSLSNKQTDTDTDSETDRQTDRQTDKEVDGQRVTDH